MKIFNEAAFEASLQNTRKQSEQLQALLGQAPEMLQHAEIYEAWCNSLRFHMRSSLIPHLHPSIKIPAGDMLAGNPPLSDQLSLLKDLAEAVQILEAEASLEPACWPPEESK